MSFLGATLLIDDRREFRGESLVCIDHDVDAQVLSLVDPLRVHASFRPKMFRVGIDGEIGGYHYSNPNVRDTLSGLAYLMTSPGLHFTPQFVERADRTIDMLKVALIACEKHDGWDEFDRNLTKQMIRAVGPRNRVDRLVVLQDDGKSMLVISADPRHNHTPFDMHRKDWVIFSTENGVPTLGRLLDNCTDMPPLAQHLHSRWTAHHLN